MALLQCEQLATKQLQRIAAETLGGTEADEAAEAAGALGGIGLRRLCTSVLACARQGSWGSCQETSQVLLDMAWERLHTGHWKDVSQVWRELYSLASLLQVAGQAHVVQAKEQRRAERCCSTGCDGEAGSAAAKRLRPSASCSGGSDICWPKKALLQLDCALLMGGDAFRSSCEQGVDALHPAALQLLQRRSGRPAAHAEQTAAPGADARAVLAGHSAEQQTCSVRSPTLRLPRWSLQEKGAAVPLAAQPPSLELFLQQHLLPQRPLIIRGVVELWPAYSRWRDPGYLMRVAGARTVPVEVGEHYLADGWGQRMVPLAQLLDHLAAAEAAAAGGGAAGCGGAEPTMYLAQHALFDQIPALRGDFSVPDYCSLGSSGLHSINAWWGPSNTVTPLHTDPHNNFYAQVVGRKYLRLYAPQCTNAMYPPASGLVTNTSRVDCREPNLSRFPLFADAPFLEAVLQPGDLLFLPVAWWHYLQSLSTSMGVSFWWR